MNAVRLISLVYDNSRYEADLATDSNGMLDSASGFETAVTISLFTWQRSPVDTKVLGQKHGWWGDTYSDDPDDSIGSQIWTLRREPNSPNTHRKLANMCVAALAWMKTDGIAKTVTAKAERLDTNTVALKIEITRANGGRWTGIWSIHLNRL